MSLYRFKSRETGDLVMLQPDGQHILEIIGKDASAAGVILPQQIPAAVQALRDAVVLEEATQKRLREEAQAQSEPPPEFPKVSLRLRSAPFIEMLQRCEKAQVEVVWGV
jgi:Fe-S cluster assembly ATPase SufC